MRPSVLEFHPLDCHNWRIRVLENDRTRTRPSENVRPTQLKREDEKLVNHRTIKPEEQRTGEQENWRTRKLGKKITRETEN